MVISKKARVTGPGAFVGQRLNQMERRQNNVILTHAQARVLWAAVHGVLPAAEDVGVRLPVDAMKLQWHRAGTFAAFLAVNNIMLIERGSK
jgi:hypothetical protein